MKVVKFKNLLEEEYDDICYGLLSDNPDYPEIACLCGCNGTFEPDDCQVVEECFDLKEVETAKKWLSY